MQLAYKRIINVLACVYCDGRIDEDSNGVFCEDCGKTFPAQPSGALDMRLRGPKRYPVDFEIGTPLFPTSGINFQPLKAKPTPSVDYSNLKTPNHLTRELLSYFPAASRPGALALDLGCGSGLHRKVIEHAGFEWIGLDYESSEAAILGDGHSLPFKENTFDFVLSIAVLEHIRFPPVMLREVYRVLKPGCPFIGTVAFLEPFHGNSFYHHSHLGTWNSLQDAGFVIKHVAASKSWSVLKAQATMGLFPRMPRVLSMALVYPIQLLHELWWAIGSRLTKSPPEQSARIINHAGAFTFIAGKRDV